MLETAMKLEYEEETLVRIGRTAFADDFSIVSAR